MFSKNLICKECGSTEGYKYFTPGSIFIEIILWLCFIIPGLIYTIWRLSSRHKVCKICDSRKLIPVNSPAGRDLINQ